MAIKKYGNRHRTGGFTLIEAALAIVLVAVGVVGLMALFASGTRLNNYGNDLSSAVFLAEEMRAMTDSVPFENLAGYNNLTFNGSDADGNVVSGLEKYQQQLTVEPIEPSSLAPYVGADPQLMKLTSTVSLSGKQMTRVVWLRNK